MTLGITVRSFCAHAIEKSLRKPTEPRFFAAQRPLPIKKLPAQVRVFRGCDKSRIRGVAWTTRADVAEAFAHGHRGMRPRDPVMGSAIILQQHIFFVDDDRSEREVVLDPRRLRQLVIKPFRRPPSPVLEPG